MLKRLIFAGIVAAPLAVMAVTVPGQASASIAQPITLVQNTPIQFGTIFDTTGAGGNVVLDANDVVTPDAASGLRNGGVATTGSFDITAAPNSHYTVAFDHTNFNLTRVGGAETMGVNIGWLRFSNDLANLYDTHAALVGQSDGAGVANFRTYTTLTVGAAQVPGNYTGNYNVTVLYQ
jgi:hypothetical protein